MCSPVAVAAVGLGSLMGAEAAREEATARNKALRYNAFTKEKEAQYAEVQAGQAKKRGVIEERQFRRRIEGLKGTQRAAFGASGVVVDEGSALDVLQDTAEFGEIDALTIRRNAEIEAFGFDFRATQLRREKSLLLQQKRDPGKAYMQSLLSSGSQVGANYAIASSGSKSGG